MAANAARAAQGISDENSAQESSGSSLWGAARRIRTSNPTDASADATGGATGGANVLRRAAQDISAKAAGLNLPSIGANDAQASTGTTGGLMQGASAGMTSGVGVEDDFRSTTEERLTALESGGQVNGAQTNINSLESGATSDFIPQKQQEVVRAVVDGNRPSDRGIQQMMSKRNL